MTTRFYLSALIYMLVQAVLFGIGILVVLLSPLDKNAALWMPVMIAITFLVAIPMSWKIAPRMMLRYNKRRPQH